jgi:magnesium transporter
MVQNAKKRSRKTGLPPGALVHIGERLEEEPQITVTNYDEKEFSRVKVKRPEECQVLRGKAMCAG